MLRLLPFEIVFPKDLDEVASLMGFHRDHYKLCAGGTDLLPNMKHELHDPSTIIHLSRVEPLRGIVEQNDFFSIGAMTTLSTLEADERIKLHFSALSNAAKQIGSPQVRNMGTVGGNICLDTRCLFYNQSYFWREAIGFCLKKCGDTCHVTQTGKKCVAASSNDLATALIALEAEVEIFSSEGPRRIPVNHFYVADGKANTCLKSGEIVSYIHIPKLKKGLRRYQAFAKLRNRNAIDFPMISIATRFDVGLDHKIQAAAITVNALAAKPKLLQSDWLLGRSFNKEIAKEAGEYAKARCIPLINICDDPKWRRNMVSVFVEDAIWSSLER